MTINKAQRQMLDNVGIYLPQLVFFHGQLHVALSKAKTANSVGFLIWPTSIDDSIDSYTKNIVYRELLVLVNWFSYLKAISNKPINFLSFSLSLSLSLSLSIFFLNLLLLQLYLLICFCLVLIILINIQIILIKYCTINYS